MLCYAICEQKYELKSSLIRSFPLFCFSVSNLNLSSSMIDDNDNGDRFVIFRTIPFHSIPYQGITYSMMSASWDPEREGSVLGTDEFSRNIDNIKGGLSRSRENAEVREQIMVEENRARMATSTQKQKQPKKTASTSLAEKMGDEFD